MDSFGSVDVVIPNAGVSGDHWAPLQQVDGTLAPPDVKTLEIDLIGVFYTCQLALHYLVPERETITPDSIKALILIGSLIVVYPRPGFLQYTTAKHGVLGLQRSLSPLCTAKGIRSGSVHPGYVETPMTADFIKSGATEGWPMVPIERVAATCLAVATDPEPSSSEKPWILGGGVDVERLDNFGVNDDFYRELGIVIRENLNVAEVTNA